MPLFFTPSLNRLTLRLFKLIDAEGEDIQTLADLLQQSDDRQLSGRSKNEAIQFQARVKIQGKLNTTFYAVTCLDVAILKNKLLFVKALLQYVFENKNINASRKQIIFTSALCICCATNRNKILSLVLSTNLDCNVINRFWAFQNTDLPLNIAVKLGDENSVLQLLVAGANLHCIDSQKHNARHVARSLTHAGKRKIIEALLQSRCDIQDALLAYQENNAARVHYYLAKAIDNSVELVHGYLDYVANLAIAQLYSDKDTTDYRFLKEFIRVFASILTSPLAKIAFKNIFHTFQLGTVMHLLGAYHCDAPVVPNIQKIFESSLEKINFFFNFGHFSFLNELNVEKTLSEMQEGKMPTVRTEALAKLSLLANHFKKPEAHTISALTLTS